METMDQILAEHPFLKDLAPEYLQLLAGCAKNVRFNEGEVIFRENGEANEFYLIRHGKVALDIYAPPRGTLTIETLREGDILGWSWLIPPYKWRFEARAVELTRALALDGACLRGKCEADKALGYELLKRFSGVIAQRLESTRLQLLDLYGTHPGPHSRK